MERFSLPSYAPKWARLLGLRIDWQSRPTDQERMYHNSDRNVELVVGHRGMRWACEVSRYAEYTTLHLGCPWLAMHWRIAPGKEPPVGEMAVGWGAYIHGDNLSGADLVLEWGGRRCRIALNPFRWDGYTSYRLRADGEWDATKHWKPEAKEIEWYSETHPYLCVGKASYHPNGDKPHVSITEAVATCYVEKSVRTRRWLPFWKWTEHHVCFDLSDEVGPRKGSWKGGTVGFSEPLLPGDDVATVVDRAVREGRGA